LNVPRRRLTPDESRAAAIAAARDLLLEAGPQAVTLKAVADKIGRTHANVLHHFGSAAGLQAELARSIAEEVTAKVAVSVERARLHQADPREIVDQTFDAFGDGGAGALAAWMILSGNRDALNPILDAIRTLVTQLSVEHENEHVPDSTLWLVLLALGDSLLGGPIASALGLDRDTARRIASDALRAQIAARHPA
jgi:AcrR family transcriptional regulator